LKRLRLQRPELERYRLALFAGLLLSLAFPKFNIAGLAWIAPGLILVSGIGFRGGAAFRIGFVAGMAYHLVALYWILLIPMGFPWKGVVVLGWLLLSAYCSLYQGIWVWLVWRLSPRLEPESTPSSVLDTQPSLVESIRAVSSIGWARRTVWCLLAAALWVALEMVQARFLTGFPWALLGVSQYQMIPLIQVTAFTGMYGVAFLIVWTSASLLCASSVLLSNPAMRRTWMADLFLPVFLIALVFAFGMHRVLHTPPAPRQITAALIQPSIPQTTIWDPREEQTRFQQVLAWSRKALSELPKPDLLVWPEAAVPGLFLWDTNKYDGKSVYEWVSDFARDNQIWLVMGADDAEPFPDGRVNYYNTSFLVSPTGEIIAKYRKRRLVIFGEYVPFSRWLPFLSKMVQSEGEFTPGKQPVAFRLNSLHMVTSVLICFEDIFPHLVREYTEHDTDFLLNLTNNGWFGESAAQWQHAASAVYRAIEHNVPLVRCANNGLTCWVDRNGRMHDVYFPDSRDVYKAGYKVVQVPVGSTVKYTPTFYRRYGDLFGWLCCALSGATWAFFEIRRFRITR
jgi:apolipoprotein N-acyltransferase